MRGLLELLKSGKQKRSRLSWSGAGALGRRFAFESLEDRFLLSAAALETPLADYETNNPAPALSAAKETPTVSISTSSADTPKAGEAYAFEVIFNAAPSASVQTSLSILSLQIYFDSTFFERTTPGYYSETPDEGVQIAVSGSVTGQVPILILSDLYTADLDKNFTPTIFKDTENLDNDAATDYYLRIVWNPGVNKNWSLDNFPQTLCKIQVTIGEGVENQTTAIRFAEKEISSSWTFASTPAVIEVEGREPFNTPAAPTVAPAAVSGWSDILVSWEPTENAGGYAIRYFKTPQSTVPLGTVDNIPADQTSYTVTGLDDGTRYYFQIKVLGSGSTADSEWSSAANVSTLADIPTDITFTPSETVYSGDPAGTLLGTLSTADIDPNATFSYVIRTNSGLFALGGENGDQIFLRTSAVPLGEYAVSIQSTNSRGNFFIKNITVTIVSGKPTASSGTKLIETSAATDVGTALAVFTATAPSERLTQNDFTYTITAGDPNNNFSFNGRNLCIAESAEPLAAGNYALTVRAATPSGEYCETTYELTVYVPPTAKVSADAVTVVSGCSFLLSAEGSMPSPDADAAGIVSYEWDLDGDGEADLIADTPSVYIDSSLCRSTSNADGNRPITLRVRDTMNLVSAAQNIDVEITPSVPVIFSRAVEYASGQILKLNLQTYAFSADPIVSWTINWGEGEPETFDAGETLKAAHMYSSSAVKREYSILVTLTDAANVSRTVCVGSHTVPASSTAAALASEIFTALESPLMEEDAAPVPPPASVPIAEADDALLIYLKSRDSDETLQTILSARSGLTSGVSLSDDVENESPRPDETPTETAESKPASLLLETTESNEETDESDEIAPAI